MVYKIYFIIVFIMFINSRASLLSFIFVFILMLIAKANQKKKITRILYKNFIFIFIPIILGYMFYSLYNNLPHSHPLYHRLNQFVLLYFGNYNENEMISLFQRIVEAKLVIMQWTENWLNIMFNTGLGATINGSMLIDNSVTNASFIGSSQIHNIHFLPFALLHKYGIFGIFLFTFICYEVYKSIKILFSLKRNTYSHLSLWANIYFITVFLFALPASSFLWTSSLFWISLALKNLKIKRITK
jgi:hypothetical protein